MDLTDMKISQLLELMEAGEVSSEEIVGKCISNIEKEGLADRTYKTILKDQALEKAREIDEKRKNKEDLGALAGIPFAVTDDISTKGVLTTAGSKILENYIPPFNASVLDKMDEAGCVMLGKVKVEEFGLKPTDMVGRTLESKGAIFGLSTSMDPNKISMKPTYGLISRYGIIGATSTFGQLVPITFCVEDMALVLNKLVGYDKRDPTSIKREVVDYRQSLVADIEGIRVGMPKDLFAEDQGLDINKVVRELEELGAHVEEVTLPKLDYITPTYRILSSAEFASNTARYDGISLGYRTKNYESREDLYKRTRAEGFSKEAQKKILFGNYVISSCQYEKFYRNAQRLRRLIKEDITKLIEEYGILILPLTSKYDEGINLLANITGLPAITVGSGLQLLGPKFAEADLIRLAYVIENKMKNTSREVGSDD